MPSSSPSSKRARTSGTEASRNPLHDLYQVIYNLNVGKSDISRYVYHSFLKDNRDCLNIRLYALVDSEGEDESKKKEAVALWKGYVPLSDIQRSSDASALANSISAGEMHISGDQSKSRNEDSGGLKASSPIGLEKSYLMTTVEKLHLNHNSSSPILVKLSSSSEPAVTSLMDICCAAITKLHLKAPAVSVIKATAASTPSRHNSDDIEALRKENEKLQHDLRETRKELAAAKGGYDIVDPKMVQQVPKGTSKLQPSVKQAKKAVRGFADDDEW